MDSLEDTRSPESSNHVFDSRFESYINAVSFFAVQLKNNPSEKPQFSLPIPEIFRVFHGQPPSPRHMERWLCWAETLQSQGLQQFVCSSWVMLCYSNPCSAKGLFPTSAHDRFRGVVSCSTLQGMQQERGFSPRALLGVHKSSKFWTSFWQKIGKGLLYPHYLELFQCYFLHWWKT